MLDRVPPPELHLLMGVVNHILALMMELFGAVLEMWLKSQSITLHGRQGGGKCDGNNARKFLVKLDLLERDSKNWKEGGQLVPHFIMPLRAFNKVCPGVCIVVMFVLILSVIVVRVFVLLQ